MSTVLDVFAEAAEAGDQPGDEVGMLGSRRFDIACFDFEIESVGTYQIVDALSRAAEGYPLQIILLAKHNQLLTQRERLKTAIITGLQCLFATLR